MARRSELGMFLVGSGMIFFGAVLSVYLQENMGSTGRFTWALVMGGLASVVLMIPQLVVQTLLYVLWLKKYNSAKAFLLGNAPVLTFVLIMLVNASWSGRPRPMLARILEGPVPKSVSNIEFRQLRAMDSVFCLARFQIERAELTNLIQAEQLAVAGPEEAREIWNDRIRSTFHIEAGIKNSWQLFAVTNGRTSKQLFFAEGSSNVIFLASVH